MSDVNRFLDQYVQGGPTPVTMKQDKVSEAAAAKQRALREIGYKGAAADDVNPVQRGMTAADLNAPYNPLDIVAEQAGRRDYMDDVSTGRTNDEAFTDTALAVGSGFANSIGGIGALGLGLVNDEAGVRASQGLENFNRVVEEMKSGGMQAKRRASNVRSQVRAEESEKRFQEESELIGSGTAKLRQLGRDALAAGKDALSDDALASDLLGNAAGSLVAAGPASKALSVFGRAVLKGGMKTGAVGLGGARRALKAGTAAKMPITIGAMEGGGAYQQTVTEAYSMVEGRADLTDDQKFELANQAGLIAGAIQAPIGAVTGMLVARFEANPFKGAAGFKQMGGNILREGVEEGIQGGTGKMSSNIGLAAEVDPNRDISKGVGEDIGLGVVGGLGAGAIVQGPQAALETVAAVGSVAKDAVLGIGGAVVDRADRIMGAEYDEQRRQRVERIDGAVVAATPAAEAAVAGRIEQEAQSPEEAAEAQAYAMKVFGNVRIDPAAEAGKARTPRLQELLGGAAHKFDAVDRAASIITDQNADPAEKMDAGLYIYETLKANDELFSQDLPTAIAKIADDDASLKPLRDLEKVAMLLQENDEIKATLGMIRQHFAETLTPEAVDDVSTPEGQQAAADAVKVASLAPETLNPAVSRRISTHIDDGDFEASPEQRAALEASATLVEASDQQRERGAELGVKTQDIVSAEIRGGAPKREKGEKPMRSGTDFIRQISQAMNDAAPERGKALLEEYMLFAKHMQNKIDAVNKQFRTYGSDSAASNASKFQSLSLDREWQESANTFGITPANDESVKFIQGVALDAEAITSTANKLAELYPQLGIAPLKTESLDEALLRPRAEVVADAVAKKLRSKVAPPKRGTATIDPADTVTSNKVDPTNGELDLEVTGKQSAEPKVAASPAATAPKPAEKPVPVAQSKVSEAKAKSMSDKALNTQINRLKDMAAKNRGKLNPVENATLDVLLAERNRRGEPAQKEPVVEADPAPSAQETAEVVDEPDTDRVVLPERNQFTAKDQAKSDQANKFIGKGSVKSSTAAYAKAWGKLANSGKYTAADRVFISAEGGRPGRVSPPWAEIRRAMAAGVTFITDVEADRNRGYNVGEREVANFLTENGYVESSPGVWTKGQSNGETGADTTGTVVPTEATPATEEVTPVPVEKPVGKKPKKMRLEDLKSLTEGTSAPAVDNQVSQVSETDEDTSVGGDGAPVGTPVSETPMEQLFPRLLRTVKNWFLDSFKAPNEAKSRLTGVTVMDPSNGGPPITPISVILKALSSSVDYVKFAGEAALRGKLTPELINAYQTYISERGSAINSSMTERLAKKLQDTIKPGPNATYKGERVTFADAIENGLPEGYDAGEANTMTIGKLFNILEKNDDGTFQYNPELLGGVILAGLQWMLKTDQMSRKMDDETIAGILGIPEEGVNITHREFFREGFQVSYAKQTLADAIISFWGVTPKNEAKLSHVRGIAEAAAAEFLAGMADGNMLREKDAKFSGKDYKQIVIGQNSLKNDKQNKAVAEAYASQINDLSAMPNAIERLVLVDPDVGIHVGSPPAPKKGRLQLRNRAVTLTDEQNEVINRAESIGHRVDMRQFNLLSAIGVDTLADMLADGLELENEDINVNHKQSVDGKVKGLKAEFEATEALLAQVENVAAAKGSDPQLINTFFEFTMTKVNRLMMLGRQNPQGSKLMREVFLSTWSTVDLNNQDSDGYRMFMLAIAQHVGIKVHKQPIDMSIDEVLEATSTKLAGTIEILQEFNEKNEAGAPFNFTAEQIQVIRKELGKDMSHAALHSLLEFARYQNASPMDRGEFETSVYIEADGVTDGPINALMHFSAGPFTQEWMQLVSKGGIWFGRPGMTMNEFTGSDIPGGSDKDMYAITAAALIRYLGDKRKNFARYPAANEHMDHLLKLMNALVPELIRFNEETGEVTIDRGMTKNPLTVSIYGSGEKGIANKVTEAILDAFYAKLSRGEFPPELIGSFNALVSGVVKITKKGEYYISKPQMAANPNAKDTKLFTLTEMEKKHLTDNVLELIVGPMRDAISDAIGETERATVALRKAVQVQSIFLQYQFKQEVDDAMNKRAANDPNWGRNDFLSQKEIDTILAKLSKLSPLVTTGSQIFFMAGTENSDVETNEFGRALDGRFRSAANIYGPSNAQVKGIPYLVIGTGDGQMIQNYMMIPGSPDGLPVYDGFNYSLNDILKGSTLMNQAVWNGYTRNPLASVANSFRDFRRNIKADPNLVWKGEVDAVLNGEGTNFFSPDGVEQESTPQSQYAIPLQEALERALSEPFMPVTGAEEIEAELVLLEENLSEMALQTLARKNVMAMVDTTVDHMATAAQSHDHKGKISLDGMSESEKLETLNRLYAEELRRLKGEAAPAVSENVEDILKRLSITGRKPDENGVWTISSTTLRDKINTFNLPADQMSLLRDTLRYLENHPVTIVMGTDADLRNHAAVNGVTFPVTEGQSGKLNGFMSYDSSEVYLINATSEILVHELIHAATMAKVAAYFDNKKGLNSVEIAAIQRIEAMMEDWMAEGPLAKSAGRAEFRKAHNSARKQIVRDLAKGDRAAAVNEFMAWVLANQDLSEQAKGMDLTNLSTDPLSDDQVSKLIGKLSDLEKSKLSTAYEEDSYNEVVEQRFTTDIRAYIDGKLGNVSSVIKNLVRKVVGFAMAVGVVFSAAGLVAPSQAMAAGQSIEITQVAEVPAAAAKGMSQEAKNVYATLAPAALTTGKGFFIADKPAGKLHVFGKDGRHLSSSDTLYGINKGDRLADRPGSALERGMVTPSGKYEIRFEKSDYEGGTLGRLYEEGNDDPMAVGGVAIHSVYLGKPEQNRLGRLASATADDNRISAGCINTSQETFLKDIVPNIAELEGGTVFVIAEDGSNAPAPVKEQAPVEEEDSGLAELTIAGAAITAKRRKPKGKSTTRQSLGLIAKNAMSAIKQLVWGKKVAPNVGNDLFSNLRFNTQILLEMGPGNLHADFMRTASPSFTSFGTDARLVMVQESIASKLVTHIRGRPGAVGPSVEHQRVNTANTKATEVSKSFQNHGWDMTAQQSSTFTTLVQAFATQAYLEPLALTRANELYEHVIEKLTPEDLLRTPTENLLYAQERYNALMGKYAEERNAQGKMVPIKDEQGRSMLLPSFIALATVDDLFRSVLQKMDLPKGARNPEEGLDAKVENIGSDIMDALALKMAREGNQPSVGAAMDELTNRIAQTTEEDRHIIETSVVNRIGTFQDKSNQFMIDTMTKLSKKGIDKLTAVELSSQKRVVQLGARLGKALLSVVNAEENEDQMEGVISGMNLSEAPILIKELVAELIGRTASNAVIYDMIKVVRAYVQQVRQQFREEVPKIIRRKFTRRLTDEERTAQYMVLARTDIAALRANGMSLAAIMNMVRDPVSVQREILKAEAAVQALDAAAASKILVKAKQLGKYMLTDDASVAKGNLLRNAYAVASLWNEGVGTRNPNAKLVAAVDTLVSLYAFQGVDQASKDVVASLAREQKDGVQNVITNLINQYKAEISKVNSSPIARDNHYKGHVHTENDSQAKVIVANDDEAAGLRLRGYVKVEEYKGSNAERGAEAKSYFYATVRTRAPFVQGVMQNARDTAYGVDPATGYSIDKSTAGRITEPNEVARIKRNSAANVSASEPLLPVFKNGQVVAYERSTDPVQMGRVAQKTFVDEVIGIWRGRQAEELTAEHYNRALTDNMKAMWDKERLTKPDEYINLFDPDLKDTVIVDAVKLITPRTRAYIESVFGEGEFWARKDLVNNQIGYRQPSIGDAWTQNTRWNGEMQKLVKQVSISMFGVDAYKTLVKYEQVWQNFITDAKLTIIVKSVFVPMANIAANVKHLIALGVPFMDIARGVSAKVAEINAYTKTRLQWIELDAALAAADGNLRTEQMIKGKKQAIEDSWRRLTIWPLIEAGEFASISDAGITKDEQLLAEGRLQAYIETLTEKLPDALKTAGRYAVMTRDTALYKGLQKTVEYGDFVAKAILYDDMMKRKKKTKEQALAKVTEEFINYDFLAGRTRTYLDNMGLTWFWHFKIRAAKIGLATLRDNPLHFLMSNMLPGDFGSPAEDNIVTKTIDGSITRSFGPGMAFSAHTMLPAYQLVN